MDREMLLKHLAQAKRHAAQSETHIIRQETLIADLDRRGHDTTKALDFLKTLREIQFNHIQARERILAALNKPDTPLSSPHVEK